MTRSIGWTRRARSRAREAAVAIAALLGVGLAPSSAHAGTIIGPAVAPQSGSFVNCIALNVGTKPIEVTSAVFDGLGAGYPTAPLSSSTAVLGPGAFDAASASQAAAPLQFCHFTFKGSKSKLRFSMQVTDGSNEIDTLIELR